MAGFREKRVFLDEVKEGDILSQPVIARDGSVLLDEGIVLTPEKIRQIDNWDIAMVSVRLPEARGADSSASITSPIAEAVGDGLGLEFGELPPEEPIDWEELADEEFEPEIPEEDLEAAIEERAAMRPPVTRIPPVPERFRYEEKRVSEAERVVQKVHTHALATTRRILPSLARRSSENLSLLKSLIIHLVDNGISNREVLANMILLRRFDDFLLEHTINSTVLSLLTGYVMGMERRELIELGEAGLLHDIGMSRIPPEVWKKNGKLNDVEFVDIQKHTIFGADILESVKGISDIASVVAYQHHERFDGSGYPKGKRGKAIHEYARILAVADVYSAMIAPRPYRERILGYEAMRYILSSSDRLFDPAIVKAFLRHMALYPVGSMVELSDGRRGTILAANPFHPYRPCVRINGDGGGICDLFEDRTITIRRAVVPRDEEIPLIASR